MADIKHTVPPVEGDGISYRGIVWFIIVLSLVTLTCQLLIWVMLRAMQHQAPPASAQAAPLAQPVDTRLGHEGRVYPDMVSVGPSVKDRGPQVDEHGNVGATRLIVREPMNLDAFRRHENDMLTTYGVADATTGEYRIPVERAKALVLERGLPVRGK
jgi:hypothetical protein